MCVCALCICMSVFTHVFPHVDVLTKYHQILSLPSLNCFKVPKCPILTWPVEQCTVWSCLLLHPDVISWYHSPSHLLRPDQLPGSLQTLPGTLFSCLFASFIPTQPLPCNPSTLPLRRKPLLRFASLPALLQAVLFSLLALWAFFHLHIHCLSQHIYHAISHSTSHAIL